MAWYPGDGTRKGCVCRDNIINIHICESAGYRRRHVAATIAQSNENRCAYIVHDYVRYRHPVNVRTIHGHDADAGVGGTIASLPGVFAPLESLHDTVAEGNALEIAAGFGAKFQGAARGFEVAVSDAYILGGAPLAERKTRVRLGKVP